MDEPTFEPLSDEQLDRPLGVDLGTLRGSLNHVVAVMELWTDRMLGLPIRWRHVPPDDKPSVDGLLRRLDVVAAEFVKLGKPFDPRKLPQRKVPPIVKRKSEGIAYTPDAKEQPEKKEEKEKPREFKESALDNLIDRTKEFAEDVPEQEEEGDPNGIKEVLGRIDRKILTVALKGTSEQLKNHFLQCMSQRGAEMLREDMEALGPVKIKEVESTQQQIIAVVRQLETEGVISLKGAVGEQYVV